METRGETSANKRKVGWNMKGDRKLSLTFGSAHRCVAAKKNHEKDRVASQTESLLAEAVR